MSMERRYDEEPTSPGREHRSLTGLFSELADETATLVRKEVELARAEMSEKVNQATTGATSLAAGGAVAFAGFLFLLLAATYGLAEWFEPWLSALIVGGVVLIIGLIMLAVGRNRLSAQGMKPQRTIDSLREDRDWAREQIRR